MAVADPTKKLEVCDAGLLYMSQKPSRRLKPPPSLPPRILTLSQCPIVMKLFDLLLKSGKLTFPGKVRNLHVIVRKNSDLLYQRIGKKYAYWIQMKAFNANMTHENCNQLSCYIGAENSTGVFAFYQLLVCNAKGNYPYPESCKSSSLVGSGWFIVFNDQLVLNGSSNFISISSYFFKVLGLFECCLGDPYNIWVASTKFLSAVIYGIYGC